MSEYELLLNKITKCGRWIPEVLCRKYLGKFPNDLRVWNILFGILLNSKNNNELISLVKKLLTERPFDNSVLAMSIKYLLLAGDFSTALDLYLKLDYKKLEAKSNIHNDLYYLELLDALSGNLKTFNFNFELRNSAVNDFNRKSLKSNIKNRVDVVCYLKHDFHFVIQEKIATLLLEKGISVFFSNCLWFAAAVNPKVLILSEALYEKLSDVRSSLPTTLIVNTRHGLGDKNHAALGASQSDKICLSSDNIARLLIDEMMIPAEKVWVTGYPQMDVIFKNRCDEGDIIENRMLKTVLFAPTFNPDLSAAYMLKTNLVKSIRGNNENIKIIIKPHPHLLRESPEIINHWLLESNNYKNVCLDLDPNSNVFDIFDQCDLMISDISSVALAWLAVDKPIISLIDREKAKRSHHFSPDGIEWQMHDASTVISDPLKLSEAVNNLLINPQIKTEERQMLRNYLFGDFLDGNSAYRVALNVENYLLGV